MRVTFAIALKQAVLVARWMSNISLHTFTLGDVPPRVHGVKVRPATGACLARLHSARLCIVFIGKSSCCAQSVLS